MSIVRVSNLKKSICFCIIAISEALHHFPGMEILNAFGFDYLGLQIGLFAAGVICFAGLTVLSFRKSCYRFERIDL